MAKERACGKGHSRSHAQSARANALAALGVWDELLAMLE